MTGVTKRDFPRLRKAGWWVAETIWMAYMVGICVLLWVIT